MKRFQFLLGGLLGGCLLALPAAAFDHAYAGWGRVLATQVRDGRVDYAALKAAPAGLTTCLDEFAAVTREEFSAWTEPQQLAFLLNLYNAATLQLVVDHYPVASIKKIGGLFGSPWKLKVVRLWGEMVTLGDVEHGQLRARYREPRIHFALVCAAKGCPPLRGEPFVAGRLEAQLADQGRLFLQDRTKNRLDEPGRTLWLSPIFKWFEGDFTGDHGTLAGFVGPFLSPEDAARLARGTFTVKFTDYDWTLNAR